MLPKNIPTTAWRNFVINQALRLLDEEHFAEHIDWYDSNDYPVGHMVFNGGIYNYDNPTHDKAMEVIWTDEFKPFLKSMNVDEVDMYIYMKHELEEEYGLFNNERLTQKYNVMAMTCSSELNSYQQDLWMSEDTEAWVKFQAIWRGHNARWKNPFFTFKD
tara:strand:- start:4498 stop:4977 length:480 start_codon:yes stop_codon:yes gene_type:complete